MNLTCNTQTNMKWTGYLHERNTITAVWTSWFLFRANRRRWWYSRGGKLSKKMKIWVRVEESKRNNNARRLTGQYGAILSCNGSLIIICVWLPATLPFALSKLMTCCKIKEKNLTAAELHDWCFGTARSDPAIERDIFWVFWAIYEALRETIQMITLNIPSQRE